MARTLLITANWKMNPPPAGFDAADSPYRAHAAFDVVVFPTFLDLHACLRAGLACGGQYGHPEPDGAFTGDVSIAMLSKAGCRYVLCGHSERRMHHGESDALVGEQACAALEAGIHPIVCIGETKNQRKHGKAKDVVRAQMKAVPHGKVTFAYEPVWAIGSGDAATAEDAEEMQAFIRELLPKDARETTRILYGGSANAANAHTLLSQENVDGFIVGGASLKPKEFELIVAAAEEIAGA